MIKVNIEEALKNGTLQEKIFNLKHELEKIEEEIDRCEKALEESKKPKLAVPFCPKIEERFYGYYYNGTIFSDKVVSIEEKNICSKREKVEGLYRTEEEAKLAYEKRCAEMELFMMCDGLESAQGVYIEYNNKEREFKPNYSWDFCSTPYRFMTDISCQAAIDKLGDRKLRLIFNIPLENWKCLE